jgi:hypothetical protein
MYWGLRRMRSAVSLPARRGPSEPVGRASPMAAGAAAAAQPANRLLQPCWSPRCYSCSCRVSFDSRINDPTRDQILTGVTAEKEELISSGGVCVGCSRFGMLHKQRSVTKACSLTSMRCTSPGSNLIQQLLHDFRAASWLHQPATRARIETT